MIKKPVVAIVIALVALAAVLVVGWKFRQQGKPATAVVAADAGKQVSAPREDVPKVNAEHAQAAPKVVPNSITDKFAKSVDLSNFISENTAAAKTGNGKAAQLIASAYAECATVGADGNSYVDFMSTTIGKGITDSARLSAFQAALRAQAARCATLNANKPSPGTLKSWSDLAASEGDLSSKVSTIDPMKNANVKQGDVQGVIKDIVAAKDGDAMAKLGSVMATVGSDQAATYGKYSGTPSSVYVWQLASCSFGADCSSGGTMLKSICLSSGFCGYASLEDVYRDLLPPVQFNEIVKEEVALVGALQQGDLNALY